MLEKLIPAITLTGTLAYAQPEPIYWDMLSKTDPEKAALIEQELFRHELDLEMQDDPERLMILYPVSRQTYDFPAITSDIPSPSEIERHISGLTYAAEHGRFSESIISKENLINVTNFLVDAAVITDRTNAAKILLMGEQGLEIAYNEVDKIGKQQIKDLANGMLNDIRNYSIANKQEIQEGIFKNRLQPGVNEAYLLAFPEGDVKPSDTLETLIHKPEFKQAFEIKGLENVQAEHQKEIDTLDNVVYNLVDQYRIAYERIKTENDQVRREHALKEAQGLVYITSSIVGQIDEGVSAQLYGAGMNMLTVADGISQLEESPFSGTAKIISGVTGLFGGESNEDKKHRQIMQAIAEVHRDVLEVQRDVQFVQNQVRIGFYDLQRSLADQNEQIYSIRKRQLEMHDDMLSSFTQIALGQQQIAELNKQMQDDLRFVEAFSLNIMRDYLVRDEVIKALRDSEMTPIIEDEQGNRTVLLNPEDVRKYLNAFLTHASINSINPLISGSLDSIDRFKRPDLAEAINQRPIQMRYGSIPILFGSNGIDSPSVKVYTPAFSQVVDFRESIANPVDWSTSVLAYVNLATEQQEGLVIPSSGKEVVMLKQALEHGKQTIAAHAALYHPQTVNHALNAYNQRFEDVIEAVIQEYDKRAQGINKAIDKNEREDIKYIRKNKGEYAVTIRSYFRKMEDLEDKSFEDTFLYKINPVGARRELTVRGSEMPKIVWFGESLGIVSIDSEVQILGDRLDIDAKEWYDSQCERFEILWRNGRINTEKLLQERKRLQKETAEKFGYFSGPPKIIETATLKINGEVHPAYRREFIINGAYLNTLIREHPEIKAVTSSLMNSSFKNPTFFADAWDGSYTSVIEDIEDKVGRIEDPKFREEFNEVILEESDRTPIKDAFFEEATLERDPEYLAKVRRAIIKHFEAIDKDISAQIINSSEQEGSPIEKALDEFSIAASAVDLLQDMGIVEGEVIDRNDVELAMRGGNLQESYEKKKEKMGENDVAFKGGYVQDILNGLYALDLQSVKSTEIRGKSPFDIDAAYLSLDAFIESTQQPR